MNSKYDWQIGQNLRKLRLERRLTQEQVSAQLQLCGCDVTRSALAKIETGTRHLYPDEIYALHIILNASYDEIFPPLTENMIPDSK